MTNPLLQAYRKPNMYVTLPSGGKFYRNPPKLSVDGDLAIYPMTARDELLLKNPDALFNGEATYTIITSCCPDIPDAYEVPSCDVNVIMIAIRQASYGDDIDMDVKCPNCNHINQVKLSSSRLLSQIKPTSHKQEIELDNGFIVKLKPYNIKDRTYLVIEQIKQQKMLESLMDESVSEDERNEMFSKTFISIADLTVKIIKNVIVSVKIPDGEQIEDSDTIGEWLNSINKADYDAIKEHVELISDSGITNEYDVNCQECNHAWKTSVELDNANFFGG